jgi:hypothetical protein
MRDILSQGRDHEPGPWARRVPRLLAVAVAVVLAVVLIAVHLPHHARAPARSHQPGVSAGAGAAPPSSALPPGAAVLGGADVGVAGPTLPWDDSTRLPVSGEQPAWFWPATGRTVAIRGLPRDTAGYQFTRAVGGWVVQAGPGVRDGLAGASGGCADCANAPGPVWFVGDQARTATRIGLAVHAAPGAYAGQVWLTSYPPGTGLTTAAGSAQEVSVSGRPLGPPLRLPAGYVIDQATDRGLLLAPADPRPGVPDDRLWDPAHPAASRTFADVVAAGPGEIAWTPGCAPVCRVQILDLMTGRSTSVAMPGASSAASASFSPDGQFLAIEASFYNGGDDGTMAAQLDVVSVASGQLTVAPGTFVSSDALVGFGWPTAADSLIAELSFMTEIQVASWSPGAVRPAVASVRPGPDAAGLVVS